MFISYYSNTAIIIIEQSINILYMCSFTVNLAAARRPAHELESAQSSAASELAQK
jgi:hypothetical protein